MKNKLVIGLPLLGILSANAVGFGNTSAKLVGQTHQVGTLISTHQTRENAVKPTIYIYFIGGDLLLIDLKVKQ